MSSCTKYLFVSTMIQKLEDSQSRVTVVVGTRQPMTRIYLLLQQNKELVPDGHIA